MKIQKVLFNNRKRAFEVEAGSKHFVFPYAKLQPAPSAEERVTEASIDRELGREGFTYKLESGKEGTVHIDMRGRSRTGTWSDSQRSRTAPFGLSIQIF